MMLPRKVRVLLLQARHPNDPAKSEEIRSFATSCGVEPPQIVPHDLLEGPPSLAKARRHDALMLGGSGEFYVSKRNLPQHDRLVDFLTETTAAAHPTFASCFGFQFLIEASGGMVVHDPQNTEVGTFELTLTEAGQRDPLFGHLPTRFLAQLGRKDRAADHIQGIPTLVSSDRSPVQALRIPGKPIWATQFHPELDRTSNLIRFERYKDGYLTFMTAEDHEECRNQVPRQSSHPRPAGTVSETGLHVASQSPVVPAPIPFRSSGTPGAAQICGNVRAYFAETSRGSWC